MTPEIVAGSTNDINENSGQWLIVDIGFSSTACSCGVWDTTREPRVVTFGELVNLAIRKVQESDQPTLNLLIEAPLSVAFQQNGNPTRRRCDSRGNKHRDWYVNAGATTLIATGYLLRELNKCRRTRQVRLFEGFVSFKTSNHSPRSKKARIASHNNDVRSLKKAVWNPKTADIFDPGELRLNPSDRVESAFPFLDKNPVPPVIRTKPQRLIPLENTRQFPD